MFREILRPLSPVFLVGVAYYDVDGNHLCDPGEGLSGVRVQPDSGSRHAITSGSGGYAIPFSAATGPGSVSFSGGGLKSPVIKDFKIDGENVKRDLRITSGAPFVALVAVDKIASETGSAGDAGFQLVRVGPVDGDLKVVLSSTGVGSSAASTDDFQLSAVAPVGIKKNNAKPGRFFITIPASKSFTEIKFSAVGDKKIELPEKADFSIVPSEAYRTGSAGSLRITIQP